MIINFIKKSFLVTGQSLRLFFVNHTLRMSAALSFYTFFALAPVILIVLFLGNYFWRNGKLEAGVFNEIDSFVGHDATLQVQQIITNTSNINLNTPISYVTIAILLFSATGVFTEIQASINQIWQLKAKPKKSWLKYIVNRFISLSVIIGLGFVLLVSLVVSTGIDLFVKNISHYFYENTVVLAAIFNNILTLIVTSIFFGSLFKFLPDAEVKWKDIITSSIVTSILFMIGKFLIAFYIGRFNPGKNYGTAGSIVIILLWVYYSSMILYYGACFTKAYAQVKGRNIYPDRYAVFTEQIEIQNERSLQNQSETSHIKADEISTSKTI